MQLVPTGIYLKYAKYTRSCSNLAHKSTLNKLKVLQFNYNIVHKLLIELHN